MSRPEESPVEPDGVLIERFRRGESEAFDAIVARYRRDIYRIAFRMAGTHDDADDIAQETFLRAYRALPSFRGDSALRTWLYRIALNLAINATRSVASRRAGERALAEEEKHASAGHERSVEPDGDRRLVARERADRVREAVRSLPPKQRQVVVLRMYEELQFNEIAELVGSPIGTVKANFFHAMNNLRKVLA
jgi:RNA polymerase sigma-70 factor (ECF subfamily)